MRRRRSCDAAGLCMAATTTHRAGPAWLTAHLPFAHVRNSAAALSNHLRGACLFSPQVRYVDEAEASDDEHQGGGSVPEPRRWPASECQGTHAISRIIRRPGKTVRRLVRPMP
jgi:hypothetical protein